MSSQGPSTSPNVWAVVVAAGSGSRFGGPKQYADLGGRRVVDWSIEAARSVADGVVLVVPEGSPSDETSVEAVVAGGDSRSASVRAGLAAVPPEAEVVLVHDGARPLASRDLFRAVVDAVITGAEAAVPVVSLVDTVTDAHGVTVDREQLRAVQTPQGFPAALLRRLHRSEPEATDDASLVVAVGGRWRAVQGERWNIKITEVEDLAVAAGLLERQ